jgi:cobalt-zinc-cadmium efflux system membrane fusion protein
MKRGFFLALAVVAGIFAGASVPALQTSVQSVLGLLGQVARPTAPQARDGHGHGSGHKEGPEGVVTMSAAQIATAKIDIKPAGPGEVVRRLTAPAVVSADPDRVLRVAAKVTGTVAELRKRLGDQVKNGEVIAVLESREVADAKGEFMGARFNFDLQTTLYQREKSLYDKKIIPEQQYLKARTVQAEAQLRVNLARQKLAALDLSDEEISRTNDKSLGTLRRKEIRAPGDGRIVERRVDVGAPVGGEGQEKELYVIADTSSVWMTLAVPVNDLSLIKEGQSVLAQAGSREYKGLIIFVSPSLDPETRSAKVIASFANEDFALRSGAFLTARIILDKSEVDILVPRTALQTVNGENVVFVRTEKGFEKRDVALGDGDEESVAIVFGLDPGENIATTNTFTLKADLGKAEAEHSH